MRKIRNDLKRENNLRDAEIDWKSRGENSLTFEWNFIMKWVKQRLNYRSFWFHYSHSLEMKRIFAITIREVFEKGEETSYGKTLRVWMIKRIDRRILQ